MTTTATALKKSIDRPDEVRTFPNGRLELLTVGDLVFGRMVAEPGWRWSTSVKPLVGTHSCEVPHRTFIAEGSLHVQMDDGTELDASAGDVLVIPPGHDAWVTSDVPCVLLDFADEDDEYAKPVG